MWRSTCSASRPASTLGRRALALVDEHEVEVARDVELARAELAHADHGEGQIARRSGASLVAASSGLAHDAHGHGRQRLAGRARRELTTGRASDRVDEVAGGVGLAAEQGVAQAPDARGVGDQQVGRERARRGDVGEAAGGDGIVREQVGHGAILAVGKPPHRVGDALQPKRARRRAWARAPSAGAMTGNRFASTLPMRREGSTSRPSTS